MKVKIKGDIISNDYKWIYDWLEWESCCPGDVEKAITASADGEELEVEISSGGGEIIAGSEIYSMLRGYKKGSLNIFVSGLAASAASVIAMSGHCTMSPTALMMVHNVSGGANGDYHDMEAAAQMLKIANEAIASAYIDKTGRGMSDILKLMDNETWLTAARAKEYGLIDEVAFSESVQPLYNSAGLSGLIKPNKLEKLKNLITPQALQSPANMSAAKAKAELELLKLKTEEI